MREPSGRTRGRRTWGAVIALAVVGLVAAPLLTSLHGASDEPVRSALVGRPAPALAGTTLDGTSYDLAQAAGQVVLVNVWVSWCGPCRDELPLLAATRERLASAGMQVATIDTRDGPVAAQALLDELGVVDLPAVTDPDGRLAVSWGAHGVPETFLVGRDGTIRAFRAGRSHPNGSSSTWGHWWRSRDHDPALAGRGGGHRGAAAAAGGGGRVAGGPGPGRHPRAAHGRRRGGAGVPARRSPSPRSGQPRLRGGGPSDGCKEALV